MNRDRIHHPLCRALLVATFGFGATAAQAAPTLPVVLASNTVVRTPGAASLPATPAARRAATPARPVAQPRAAVAVAPAAPAEPVAAPSVPAGAALIEDPMGVLMDLGGYTWPDRAAAGQRRAGVLAELGEAGVTHTETADVPVAGGQPHAVAPDLLFALLVEATRAQQHRIETLEAEAVELRLALADATEAREDQARALAAIQAKLGLNP